MELHLQRTIWSDYFNLTKPRTIALHLVTATVAMFLAVNKTPTATVLIAVLTGGALTAGGSNTLNCFLDRNIDAVMPRTKNRPIPAGRVKPFESLLFGLAICLIGLLVLMHFTGFIVALLAACAIIYYDLIYTLWLKRRTSWSAVIGSGAGAFPVLIGWYSVAHKFSAAPLLLFGIIALWSPPHFWSLALYRRKEYARASLIVSPAANASRWVWVFTLLTVVVSLIFVPVSHSGALYGYAAVALGAGFLLLAFVQVVSEESKVAQYLYVYSIIYLAMLFAAMLADHLVFVNGGI